MDITLNMNNQKFNYRVCGIIVHNNKLLALKNERTPYYFLPGGRVKLNETVNEAILREMKEELDIDANIVRPLWFNQSFFNEDVTGINFHEICMYFLVDVSDTDILSKGDRFTYYDEGQALEFEWIEFDRLKDEYIYPTFIKDKIYDLPKELTILEERE